MIPHDLTGHRQSSRISAAILILPIVLLAACGSTEEVTAPVEPPAPETEALVAGYHPWWLRNAWETYDRSVYDEIYFFSVEVDSSGSISERNGWPDRWYAMQRDLSNTGVRVTPVVTLFSQSEYEHLFDTRQSSAHLMETLLSLLRDSPAVGGLQLDFEVYQPVPDRIRTNFAEFVERLKREMASIRPDLVLSLYLLAYDQSDVFDEARIAEQADYVVVQGYDLHGRTEDRTGPVAGLEGWGDRNWNAVVRRFRDLGVPASKIVISVPFYGYEWPAESPDPGARTRGSGRTISYAPVDTTYLRESPPSAREAARRHGLERDQESGSPYYAYEDSTGWRQGWFEDAESLERKFEWVAAQGLRGVAVFPPAYGTEELERLLAAYFGTGGL